MDEPQAGWVGWGRNGWLHPLRLTKPGTDAAGWAGRAGVADPLERLVRHAYLAISLRFRYRALHKLRARVAAGG